LQRTHRWALADRVAWNEETYRSPNASTATLLQQLQSLISHLQSLISAAELEERTKSQQLEHGDLAGNVLFTEVENAAPAIIDFSPYWRARGWAEAMGAADGVLWFGAGEGLVGEVVEVSRWSWEGAMEMVCRALVFRTVSVCERGVEGGLGFEEEDFWRAVGIVERLVARQLEQGRLVDG
jgi:hypothetical protein